MNNKQSSSRIAPTSSGLVNGAQVQLPFYINRKVVKMVKKYKKIKKIKLLLLLWVIITQYWRKVFS